MKPLMRAVIRCSLMLLVTAPLFSVQPAQAYTVTLEQVGSNVVATGSGPINLTGLTLPGTILSDPAASIFPSQGAIATGPASGPVVQIGVYNFAASGPTSFDSGHGAL